MKSLNHTCVEKLPFLLGLKKGDPYQTIRKAWEYQSFKGYKGKNFPKPPKFKVGDIVDYGWDFNDEVKISPECSGSFNPKVLHKILHKNLGKIKITEVFKIKIIRTKVDKNWYNIIDDTGSMFAFLNEEREKLAKRDGFNSAEEMFNYFDKKYDLSTPKEFYVYRGIVQ